MNIESKIIKKVWGNDFKFQQGTKKISSNDIQLGQHYATDSYSGASQLRGKQFRRDEIEESDGKKYTIISLGIGHFDDVEIYALKFKQEDISKISNDKLIHFINQRYEKEVSEVWKKIRVAERRVPEEGLYEDETKQCWECGRTFTLRDSRAHDGDWNDSYCGC